MEVAFLAETPKDLRCRRRLSLATMILRTITMITGMMLVTTYHHHLLNLSITQTLTHANYEAVAQDSV